MTTRRERATTFLDRHLATIFAAMAFLATGYFAGQTRTSDRIGALERDVAVLKIELPARTEDRYPRREAEAAHVGLRHDVERNTRDIEDIERHIQK